MLKGGVNDFGREHGDECSESMKVEGGEIVHREFCQAHVKGNV